MAPMGPEGLSSVTFGTSSAQRATGGSERCCHSVPSLAAWPRSTSLARRRVVCASQPIRVAIADAGGGRGPLSGTRNRLSVHWSAAAQPPEAAASLLFAWHTRPGRRTRRRLAHLEARARHHDDRPASRVLLRFGPGGAGALARSGCGRRARRGGVGLRHSIWRGGRRYPLVLPRRAATRLHRVLHFVAALRVRPASAGGTSGSLLPPTRHSGAGCGG